MATAQPDFSPTTGLARKLLGWFDRNRRDLPWRHSRDPYRIWVSEVMLQQTTVAAVIPYFKRFIAAYPNVTALANADEQDVLRLWEGLGYYRRARHLCRAARMFVQDYGGQLPDDPAIWATLPGVGRYMVGAVLSQAFDRRLPIVEANSRRVLCRLSGERRDPTRTGVNEQLWSLAERLLPRRRVGDFNQALMELGALVCTPTSPRCAQCPLATACAARRAGTQSRIPKKAPSLRCEDVFEIAVVVRRRNRVLLVQRPDYADRWAGMWEFPHQKLARSENRGQAGRRMVKELTGLAVEIEGSLGTIHFGVTRFRMQMACFAARYVCGKFKSDFYSRHAWVPLGDLGDYPIGSPHRRIARKLLDPDAE